MPLLWPYLVSLGRIGIMSAGKFWVLLKTYPGLISFAGITAIVRSQLNDFFDFFTNPESKDTQGASAQLGIFGFYTLVVALLFLLLWLFRSKS